MIIHKAISVDDRPIFFVSFQEVIQKDAPVSVGEDDRFFLIPSGRDMIEGPRILDSELSGHSICRLS